MSADPYSPASYYEPPAEPVELRRFEPPHSGLGIASFLVGLLAGVGEMAVVGWAGYTGVTHRGTITPDSPTAILLGLAMLAGLGLALLGGMLGVGGLFQANRKRVFAVLGMALNALVVLAFLGLMVIGLALKK
jgi:hypothetical protein